MAKQRTITLTKVLGPPPTPVTFRIVIEGLAYGDVAHVKERAMEEIHNALIIGPGVTGASVIYVTTLRGANNNGQVVLRGGGKGTTMARSAKPGLREDQPKRRTWGKNLTKLERTISALKGTAVRFNWPQERLDAEIARRKAGGAARHRMNYTERLAAGDKRNDRGKVVFDPALPTEPYGTDLPLRVGRPRGSKDSVPRKGKRRVPRGLTVVEVTPNGSRILSDGSRLTAQGRHVSAEGVARMQAAVAENRKKRHSQSFPQPPEVASVEPQEAIEAAFPTQPSPRKPVPSEEVRGVERWKRALGLTRSMVPREDTAANSLDHMVEALPVERPDISDAEWDVIVTHWLEPSTDPVALCRNYHVTRAQLDHELERRQIRPYNRTWGQASKNRTLAPQRQH